MPISTTYLLPAILLNPAFILHLVNTFVSHIIPPSTPVTSHSPHPFMESMGPVPGSTPYWDVHADDALCWRYTAVMVVVQVLAFGRVQDNRVRRRDRKAAKMERERSRREQIECGEAAKPVARKSGAVAVEGSLDGAGDSIAEDCQLRLKGREGANGKARSNGKAHPFINHSRTAMQTEGLETESEASLTETSEEEMMI